MKIQTLSLALLVACQSAPLDTTETEELSTPSSEVLVPFGAIPEMPLPALLDVGLISSDMDDDDIAAERARRDLLAQKTHVMVERYLANARDLEEQLKLNEARRELERALQLDPGNQVVRGYLDLIEGLLGEPDGQAALLARNARERYEAQREQRKVIARNDLEQAKLALERDQPELALQLARGVVQQVSWSQDDIDWGSIAPESQDLLNRAEQAVDFSGEERLEVQRQEAYQRLRAEQTAEVAQDEARIQSLLIAATRAFDGSDFEKAEDLSRNILVLDRHNHQASAILDASLDAAREYSDRLFVQRRREEFNRWRNEIERVRIPNAQIFSDPDAAYWNELTDQRTNFEALGVSPKAAEELALRDQLSKTRMDVEFDDITISEVAESINANQGIPFSVDPEVAIDLDDQGETVNLRGLRNVTAEAVLNLLTEQVGEDLAWTLRNGRVYLTTKEKASSEPVIRVHSTEDLFFGFTDFKGPNLRSIALPDEFGDDPETTRFSSELDRQPHLVADDILNLVRENVAKDDWDLSDSFNIDIVDDNNLLVIHTPEVQAEVADFLDELRSFNTNMVTLESRFFSITDAFVEQIGTDLRGLDPSGPFASQFELPAAGLTGQASQGTPLDNAQVAPSQGLDNNGDGTGNPNAGIFFDDSDQFYSATSENFFSNPFRNGLSEVLSTTGGGAFQFTILDDASVNLVLDMVSKSQDVVEITAPIVTVYNTQRAFVTVVNQVSYVQTFNVDVATSAFIADPVIGVIQEGIVLDVRPTIDADRKFVTLDVQTTVAELERPFRTVTTLLGPNGSPVTFSIPALHVQDAQTTVSVPDGGGVVLGGFKHVRYKSRTAEAPWFADIPILGFFFREKGLADEVTDLIIVIRAKIVDFEHLR